MSSAEAVGDGLATTVPFYINGADYTTDKTFDVISPATGQVVHRCGAATEADAACAVDAAAQAFEEWRKTSPSFRRNILLKAAEIMERRRDDTIQCMMKETGSTSTWGEFNVDGAVDLVKDVAGRISSIEGSIPAMVDPTMSGIVLHEPYGVVLAIAPWNAPCILATRSFIFPIAAGNTVVLKASELSPRTIRTIVSAFHEAGLPPGVLNMIAHEPAAAPKITAALVSNPLVRKINFTGSTAVGRIIAKLAGEHLKPLILELGGKAPAIVWEDADLELAASQCALGSFLNSGQICMSTERIIVHKAIKQEFLEKLKAATESLFPADGEPLTLISSVAVEKNKALVKDAVDKGASLIHGDPHREESNGYKLRPLILDNVTTDMNIYPTESFGPTASLFEVETEEAAIKIANDTEYGLSSAVFTEDLRRGLRFARAIETGAVHINGMTVHDEAGLSHGGAKASGYGRFNSSAGLGEWVRTKNVTFRT